MTVRLEVSLGPVQGFVAAARRTRDLWGGSFLLSFLSGHGMAAVVDTGAEVQLPNIADDPLFAWIRHRQGSIPSIGSLPNHFISSEVDEVTAQGLASAVTRRIETQWRFVTDAVWDKFVEPMFATNEATNAWDRTRTRGIWDRQVNSFWDIRWVLVHEGDHNTLARRKLWNARILDAEPGDKCTIMPEYQELSGFSRSAGEAKQQDQFWASIRQRAGAYDLREGERLSAVALVKRLFPRVEEDRLGWKPPSVVHWPSTVHLGGQPWLKALSRVDATSVDAFAQVIEANHSDAFIGRAVQIPGVGTGSVRGLRRLDPSWWNRPQEATTDAVKQAYADLDKTLPEDEPRPSQFYALLLADGDRVGRLVAKHNPSRVSAALAQFTSEVPEIVRDHDGVTVYAGGDDVLAMLPIPTALECSLTLADSYRRILGDAGMSGATLSAGVVLAHVRRRLTDVLETARDLLDKEAKDGNGRDSLAVGLLKPGGLQAKWTTTWQVDGTAATERLALLVQLMTKTRSDGRQLSESALHSIRAAMARMFDWQNWTPGRTAVVHEGIDGETMMRGILEHDAAAPSTDLADYARLIWSLSLTQPARRSSSDRQEASIDALVIASFLADGWQGSHE